MPYSLHSNHCSPLESPRNYIIPSQVPPLYDPYQKHHKCLHCTTDIKNIMSKNITSSSVKIAYSWGLCIMIVVQVNKTVICSGIRIGPWGLGAETCTQEKNFIRSLNDMKKVTFSCMKPVCKMTNWICKNDG